MIRAIAECWLGGDEGRVSGHRNCDRYPGPVSPNSRVGVSAALATKPSSNRSLPVNGEMVRLWPVRSIVAVSIVKSFCLSFQFQRLGKHKSTSKKEAVIPCPVNRSWPLDGLQAVQRRLRELAGLLQAAFGIRGCRHRPASSRARQRGCAFAAADVATRPGHSEDEGMEWSRSAGR